jgi:hypothetical protein
MHVPSDRQHLQDQRLGLAIKQYRERLFGQYLVVEEGRFRSRRLLGDLS